MNKPTKRLILIYGMILTFFTSLYIGIVPISVLTYETAEFQATSIDVIEDTDTIVSYSELSDSEQEMFRDAVEDRTINDKNTFNSNPVVQLDGSYYTLNTDITWSISVFLLLFITLVSSSVIAHYSKSPKSGIVVFVFISMTIVMFMPQTYMLYISEKPVDVKNPENVLDVTDLDKDSKNIIYSHIEGGNSLTEEDVDYTSISDLTAQGYIRDTYSYISSDGELYKIQSSLTTATERRMYQKASIIMLIIGAIANILYVYREQFKEETS